MTTSIMLDPMLAVRKAPNPCLSCGACCAHYRVAFYWTEADDALGGTVPAALTRRLSLHARCMLGTDRPAPRCVALAGEIGRAVECTIYAQRPTPCREFAASGEGGVRNAQCDKARAAWGLPPLPLPLIAVAADSDGFAPRTGA